MGKKFLINLHLSFDHWIPTIINIKNKNFSLLNDPFTENNINDFDIIIPLNIPAIESIKK